ncbi:MAG TPA: hypothetical protein VF510_16130 [Ktedonobacterales bacterium]
MQAAPAPAPAPAPVPPGLPGASASKAAKGMALVLGALVLVGFVPLALLQASSSGARGGHLPSSARQWAVTTPTGTLTLIALCILVLGSPYILYARWLFRREVARASDITDVPLVVWPTSGPARSPRPLPLRRPLLQRWLGRGRRERAVSLVLLTLGTLLAVALVGVFFASAIVSFRGLGDVRCDSSGNHCSPSFPLTGIPVASMFAVIALTYLARSRWLQRVEATSRVWLRYRDWTGSTPLCYVRQPGVTPEAAMAALARFSSARAVPVARQVFVGVLVAVPYVVLAGASFVLGTWLQLHWLPR